MKEGLNRLLKKSIHRLDQRGNGPKISLQRIPLCLSLFCKIKICFQIRSPKAVDGLLWVPDQIEPVLIFLTKQAAEYLKLYWVCVLKLINEGCFE